MAKLTKQEITALASKIMKEACPSFDDRISQDILDSMKNEWEEFKKSSDYEVLDRYKATGMIKKEEIIDKREKDGITYYTSHYLGGKNRDKTIALGDLTIYLFNLEKPKLRISDIETEIILAQIGSQDLNSIIEKVKQNLGI